MAIDEKTRLDLRQAFANLIGSDLADAAMEAMPNIDYTELATKTDVDNVRIELRGEMAELRGEMAELRGDMAELRADVKGDVAQLRGDMAQLRGEMGELRGDLRSEMTTNLRISLLTQVGTTVAILGTVVGLA